jgi:hypothetical protein
MAALLCKERRPDEKIFIDCSLPAFGRTRLRPVGWREERSEFDLGHQPGHPGLRERSRDQRHVRDRIEQTCRRASRWCGQEICQPNGSRPHENLDRIKGDGSSDAPIPTALDSSHQSKLDKLKGLNGADFTKQYNDMQVSAHKDAVSLFERYGKGGDNAKLKDWASKTLPALKHHLEMAQALNK